METTITTEKQIYTGQIVLDQVPLNPREEFDNLFTIINCHDRYLIGDLNYTVSNLNTFLQENKNKIIFYPLYMYDHSGISLSINYSYPYNNRWDSSQIGIVYIEKSKIYEEYNRKRITKKLKSRLLTCLKGEIKIYNAYLSGQVYGYEILEPTGDLIESCYGYYDFDYCRNTCIKQLNYLEIELITNLTQRRVKK